jgi:hypothetical protein
MPKSKDIKPLTLKCQCGNKDRDLFKTIVIVTTKENYEDIPGTTYVWIQCIKCFKHHDITSITRFSGRLHGDDEEEEEDDEDDDDEWM